MGEGGLKSLDSEEREECGGRREERENKNGNGVGVRVEELQRLEGPKVGLK